MSSSASPISSLFKKTGTVPAKPSGLKSVHEAAKPAKVGRKKRVPFGGAFSKEKLRKLLTTGGTRTVNAPVLPYFRDFMEALVPGITEWSGRHTFANKKRFVKGKHIKMYVAEKNLKELQLFPLSATRKRASSAKKEE